MVHRSQFVKPRRNYSQIIIPIVILFFTVVVGVVGYSTLWSGSGATFMDAVYMTFITITTVGYQEVVPLDTYGRVITIFVSVVGIGSLFYLMGAIMEKLVSEEMNGFRTNRAIERKLDKLHNHYIVVGVGRVGAMAIDQLKNLGKEFVVLSQDFEDEDLVNDKNIICIQGDATEEKNLELAGIERATGMIVAVADAAISTFVIISARGFNPDMYIVARSDEIKNDAKLERAGANRIVNPYRAGGHRLANMMVNRNVVDIIETNLGDNLPQMNLETLSVSPASEVVGKTLKEIDFRKHTGVTILVILHCGNIVTNPDADYKLLAGDILTVFGKRDELKKVEKLLG
jgi:voltage-gated potassium channel